MTLYPLAMLTLLLAMLALADATPVCGVYSLKFPDLMEEANRKVICGETILALTGSYDGLREGATLQIFPTERSTYAVLLEIRWKDPKNSKSFTGQGVLNWSPDGAFVRLEPTTDSGKLTR